LVLTKEPPDKVTLLLPVTVMLPALPTPLSA
jgi:hypothetical protein